MTRKNKKIKNFKKRKERKIKSVQYNVEIHIKKQGRKCQFTTLCKLLKTFFGEFEWKFNSLPEKVL